MLGALHAGRHETILVHGVTGSGKTEVYIAGDRRSAVLRPAGDRAGARNQPHAANRGPLSHRFGHVAVLHSHQSDAERRRHWDAIAAGQVPVVVGARSAVFAPTPNLGIIVLDEEHESSFKQETAPRYHARDVALQRAEAERVPLVLGSATPSLESWQRADRGEYRLVSLPERVFNRPLPAVGTIDLRIEFQDRRNRGAVSRQLHMAMDAALREGGQVILLLNRRGFSTHIQCPSAANGRMPALRDCADAPPEGQMAVCHYCDYQVPAPAECPECHFAGIQLSGAGHAAARGRGEGPLSGASLPADGYRHDAEARQPRGGADAVFTTARCASCWARR